MQSYTYTIESFSDNIKKINLHFIKNYIENIYNEEADKIKNNVTIKGFRPGKAPEHLFRKLFFKDLIKSKISEILNDISKEIITKEKIKPFSNDLVFYKKEDIDNIVENNYTISLEIPSLPDFAQINFNEITLKNIPQEQITDEFVNNFIEIEKLKLLKMNPKQNPSQENDILQISFNLYENVDEKTNLNIPPTKSTDNVHLFLNKNLLPYFCKIHLNDYNIDLNDLLGLETGTFKKIICTKIKDGIIQKAHLDIWVKKIYVPEKNDNIIQEVMKLWQVDNENSLKTNVTDFLNQINEYERKIALFQQLLNTIITKYNINIDYPPHLEKVIAKSYLEDFVRQSNFNGTPKDVIEKYLKTFNINDNNYRIYKLKFLLIQYFSQELKVNPTPDDIFKIFCLVSKIPPYIHLKDEIFKNENTLNIIIQQFISLKTIENILSTIKIEDNISPVILSP